MKRLRAVALLASLAVLAGLGLVGISAGPGELTALVDRATLRAPIPDPRLEELALQTGTEAVARADAQGLPATVQPVTFAKHTISYPVFSPDGQQIGTTAWRVVRGTGNCCENHLGATKTGRLLDFGGAYLNFSDDKGVTWKRVRPAEPLVGPEGTVVNAPGGDIVGVTWDPYTGDRVLAFKMDGATGTWEYMYTALHTPFYDREWIAVIPGPHTIAGQTFPYITVMRGGFPSKDVWFYSLDGLHYAVASNKMLAAMLGGTTSRWLPATPDPEADWTQPISEASIAPLNGGGAIAYRVDVLETAVTVEGILPANNWWILEPSTLVWKQHRLATGTQMPRGRLVQDSRGWSHLVSVVEGEVTYRLSQDGGQTWSTATASLPPSHRVEEWDFRANGGLGLTAVAVHAHNDATDKDQDLVLRFATVCGVPELVETHFVGTGDTNAGRGLGASIRFDFATTAILPDGTIATSLLDRAHLSPALAVELETTYTPGYEPPALSCGAPAP
ncbi:MAG TPA: hypothetical protein VG602_00395 [Actinomycetota bacterium]|nr:hypothetical protein [Actinomycetota bacterium]